MCMVATKHNTNGSILGSCIISCAGYCEHQNAITHSIRFLSLQQSWQCNVISSLYSVKKPPEYVQKLSIFTREMQTCSYLQMCHAYHPHPKLLIWNLLVWVICTEIRHYTLFKTTCSRLLKPDALYEPVDDTDTHKPFFPNEVRWCFHWWNTVSWLPRHPSTGLPRLQHQSR